MRKVFKASFFKEVEKKYLDKKYKGDTLRKQIDRVIDDINVYDCIAQTILDTPILEWQNNLIAYLNKYTKSGYVIKPFRSMSSEYGKESLYILIIPKGPTARSYEVDIHLWKEKIGTY